MSLSVLFWNCSDFLDREPSFYSSTGFYKSEAAVHKGVTGVYSILNANMNYNLPTHIVLDHWTPLAAERMENNTIGAGGALTPDNNMVKDYWSQYYRIIARVNAVIRGAEPFLEHLKNDGKAFTYLAEARVLRAYSYYMLVAAYGDIPLFTAPVEVSQYTDERKDKVEVLNFILQELEEAAKELDWIAKERGRVDKAVALGLRARAALLGGSLDYGGKGKEYFKIAAESAKEVIGNRKLAQDFDDLFNLTGQAKADVRNEILFELMYTNQGNVKFHMAGFGQVSRNYGQTGRHPLQLLVDTYECIDGKRIDESPLYNPKEPNKNRDPRLTSTIWFHKDVVEGNTTGTDKGRIKFVLELYNPKTKFYNFDTGQWELRNNADINSAAAWTSFANAGVGYMWKKFSNETEEAIGKQTCNLPILRYAEVLLSYAEAKIELNELDESVYDAINQVRNRSGMPNVSADRIGNQEKMRQLVRRERKVELILEGLHFVDMRRWKIGEIANDSPSYGYPLATKKDAEGNLLEGGYQDATPDMVPTFKKSPLHDLNDIANYDAYKEKLKVRDANRFWKPAFELLPIPQWERDNNKKLSQNEGY